MKNVTSEHLQAFFDLLSFGGTYPDGSERKGYSKDYIRSFSAVLQQSFRFAVSPKQYITFNPMQYIKLKYQTDEVDLFSDDDMDGDIQPIPREDYERLIEFLQDYNPPAILPIQIAYYAGLRIGEACAGYMLRIDCCEAENNLTTTPGSDCALNALAIDEPLEYARLYLDGTMQMWIDAKDSF